MVYIHKNGDAKGGEKKREDETLAVSG